MTAKHHHTQTSEGEIADRHASVLLAKNPDDLEAAYDTWAQRYDEDLTELSGMGVNGWGRTAAEKVLKLCDPRCSPCLLDFGCGTGGTAGPIFQEAGWTSCLHGCDLSQGMLDMAYAKGCYTKLIKSSSLSSGAEAGFYDIIHANGVFAPGQAPPDAFHEFVRLLKPGGIAIFTVRTGYYDEPEGADHKQRLQDMCRQKLWKLESQTEEEYLPKDNVTCYVFVMKKL